MKRYLGNSVGPQLVLFFVACLILAFTIASKEGIDVFVASALAAVSGIFSIAGIALVIRIQQGSLSAWERNRKKFKRGEQLSDSDIEDILNS